MHPEKFQAGDVVYLKSGSPAFTVASVDHVLRKVDVVAWSCDQVKAAKFPFDVLTHNDPNFKLQTVWQGPSTGESSFRLGDVYTTSTSPESTGVMPQRVD